MPNHLVMSVMLFFIGMHIVVLVYHYISMLISEIVLTLGSVGMKCDDDCEEIWRTTFCDSWLDYIWWKTPTENGLYPNTEESTDVPVCYAIFSKRWSWTIGNTRKVVYDVEKGIWRKSLTSVASERKKKEWNASNNDEPKTPFVRWADTTLPKPFVHWAHPNVVNNYGAFRPLSTPQQNLIHQGYLLICESRHESFTEIWEKMTRLFLGGTSDTFGMCTPF